MSAETLRRAAVELRRDWGGEDFYDSLADWLDEVHANLSTYNSYYHKHAFAVARAYLGES